MKIEYNGEMVEAYDLIISKKTAEQIIRGEKTCDIRDFTKFYQDKFGDPEKVKQNIQAEKEGRDDDFVAPSRILTSFIFETMARSRLMSV